MNRDPRNHLSPALPAAGGAPQGPRMNSAPPSPIAERKKFEDPRFSRPTRPNGPVGPRPRRIGRAGFSMIELLIALSISGLLLSACLVALDASFKSYEVTTESASTHVVSRMVMYRTLAMIRSGEEFGPYPLGVLTPTKITSDYIEFVSKKDEATSLKQITRLERVPDGAAGSGMYQLMYKRWDYLGQAQVGFIEYPLIRNLRSASFTLEYDRGPKLTRATIDMSIKPDDDSATAVATDLEAKPIRLIASTSPRRLD